MIIPLAILAALLFFIWKKAFPYPKNFPPGPRFPLPIAGDGYVLGKHVTSGLMKLKEKYGKIVGLYFGPRLTIIISDFDDVNELLTKEETADRPPFPAIEEARQTKT